MEELKKEIDLLKEILKDGDLADARIICEKLVTNNPAHTEINYLMGYIFDKLNLIKRAEEFLQKALNLDSNHYDTLVELSLFHEKNGDHDKASLFRERSFRIANKITQS
ncbi:MAG: tetratricopeptide repeat protein [Melioribacteraceae bacterium]|nr:tetratricopeptide repeat protein [Melioribacteraceae bacterium]